MTTVAFHFRRCRLNYHRGHFAVGFESNFCDRYRLASSYWAQPSNYSQSTPLFRRRKLTMLWLWCLASFIVGITIGVGLMVFLLLGAASHAAARRRLAAGDSFTGYYKR